MSTVNSKMTAIADEIRVLSGTSDTMGLDAMKTHISEANDEIDTQTELVSQIAAALQNKVAGSGSTDEPIEVLLQSKTVTPTTYQQTVTADEGYDGLEEVVVNAIPSEYVIPSGTLTISQNGSYDVTNYASATVDVEGSSNDEVLTALVKRTITEFSDPTLTEIGGYAFYYCDKLASVHLPAVTTMGGYAFGGCTILPKIELPLLKKVTSNCFRGCMGLVTADFGGVTSIETNAFYNCQQLTALIIRTPTTAYISSSTTVLNNTPIINGTGYIYVPAALIENYKASTNWSTYAAQFRALEDYTVDGTTSGALDETKI